MLILSAVHQPMTARLYSWAVNNYHQRLTTETKQYVNKNSYVVTLYENNIDIITKKV